MLCPICHTLNRDNAKFCKGCGQTLAVETVAADPAVPVSSVVEGQPTEQVGAPSVSTSQPLLVDTQNQAPDLPNSTPATETARETEQKPTLQPEDPSKIPTQILTQQEMLAFHSRRWRQEIERAQREHSSNETDQPDENKPSVPDASTDVADVNSSQASSSDRAIEDEPTILIPPTPVLETTATRSESTPEPDITELPTVAIKPETSTDSQSAPPPPPLESEPDYNEADYKGSGVTGNQASEPAETEAVKQESKTVQEEQNTQTEAEETANQNTPVSENQSSKSFVALQPGSLVGERYEVTQILNDAPEQHVYEVTDRKGYLRCWNCGSDSNTEGDEFCNDCGAELLNASYIMHEFPPASQQHDTNVFQGNIADTFIDKGNTYVIELPQALQSSFSNGVHLLAAGESDAGMERRESPNEDSTLILQIERMHESVSRPAGIFLVADGMGGHDSGQDASRLAVNLIAQHILSKLLLVPIETETRGETLKEPEGEELEILLREAIEGANTHICQRNQRERSDMGCTLTGFMIIGEQAYIFNVGDSRTYMLREGTLYQLTNDHSLVGQLVAGGLITPDEVYSHPQRSQIYRSIGDKQNVQIDVFKQQIHPGDILLSCSDGLWEMVRDPQIADILNNASDPQTASSRLIETANTNGGEDNVSAVVVFVR